MPDSLDPASQIAECQHLRRLVADLNAVSHESCQSRFPPSTGAAREDHASTNPP